MKPPALFSGTCSSSLWIQMGPRWACDGTRLTVTVRWRLRFLQLTTLSLGHLSNALRVQLHGSGNAMLMTDLDPCSEQPPCVLCRCVPRFYHQPTSTEIASRTDKVAAIPA